MDILDVQKLTEKATRMRSFRNARMRIEDGYDFFGTLAVAEEHVHRAAALHPQVFNGMLNACLYHPLFDLNLTRLLGTQ
jgi:hypothetical protein